MDVFEMMRLASVTFEACDVEYFVTGSLATIAHGEPRLTIDADIVADLKLRHVPAVITAFPPPDFYCTRGMIEDAVRSSSQFNIIHPESGAKVDVMIPKGSDFDQSRFTRRMRVTTRGVEAFFATPEDAILKKLEYFREGGSEKHIRDIRGVLSIQGDALDFDYIDLWAEKLGVVEQFRLILELDSDAESF